MESKNTKLLEALRNSGSDKIYEAYEWLQAHHHELQKKVYGPVLLEVLPDRDIKRSLLVFVTFFLILYFS